MKKDAQVIINNAIKSVLPEEAVKKALSKKVFEGKVIVVAIGKAAWNMAKATKDVLGNAVEEGIVITKYEHSKGPIDGFEIIEAGHPILDDNSILGTKKALALIENMTKKDTVIFLVSGGGSALFEKPKGLSTLDDIKNITNQLLASGADIVEINTIRKHLSDVKGGRFAEKCNHTNIFSIVLSDVVGDRLDSIASGPAYPDSSTSEEALTIIKKYNIKIDDKLIDIIKEETPKEINNCETIITGSVTELCNSAAKEAKKLGYNPYILSTSLEIEAKEAGKMLASMSKEIIKNNFEYFKKPVALIMGGENTVQIKGNGLGGRNQEFALATAIEISKEDNICIFSVGSDGTDGPTDAAGGIVDGNTYDVMLKNNINPEAYLDNNDSYNALKISDSLVITGATGTNVNDFAMALIG